MSRREEVLQINTSEQWERLGDLKGLTVVDVYSECFGPCSAMLPTLKKIKQRVRNNLHLAIAKCDNIEQLKRFRNKSQPTWMFLVEGKLMNIMYGANAPKLELTVMNELKMEMDIKEGTRTRDEFDKLDITDLPEPEEEIKPIFPKQIEEDEEEQKSDEAWVLWDDGFPYCPFGID